MSVVERCGLTSVSRQRITHAGLAEEPDETEAYLVNILLPNRLVMQNVRVYRAGFTGADVLIGMDIINAGDFAITHAGGNTKFTFQMPSLADIDFLKGQA